MARHPLLLWALLSVVFGSVGRTCAFTPSPSIQRASTASFVRQTESSGRIRRPLSRLFADSNDDDDDDDDDDDFTAADYGSRMQTRARDSRGSKQDDDSSIAGGGILQRFLSPRVDDPGLPLTDVLLAQIVAPTLQVYYVALARSPNPSWLVPMSSYFGEAPELAPRGSLLAPALIHGAGLAVCWLAGALAARSWEREAFTVKPQVEGGGPLDLVGRYDNVLFRLFQAGAFASGILILSTQTDLLLEFGRYVQYGESDSTDLRLAVATVEVVSDIFWEAVVIGTWRIIHAKFMSTPTNWERRF